MYDKRGSNHHTSISMEILLPFAAISLEKINALIVSSLPRNDCKREKLSSEVRPMRISAMSLGFISFNCCSWWNDQLNPEMAYEIALLLACNVSKYNCTTSREIIRHRACGVFSQTKWNNNRTLDESFSI